jgi:hypothetical protein
MTTTDRPANQRYREHVLYHCQALRDEQCDTCLRLAREASAESWRAAAQRAAAPQ